MNHTILGWPSQFQHKRKVPRHMDSMRYLAIMIVDVFSSMRRIIVVGVTSWVSKQASLTPSISHLKCIWIAALFGWICNVRPHYFVLKSHDNHMIRFAICTERVEPCGTPVRTSAIFPYFVVILTPRSRILSIFHSQYPWSGKPKVFIANIWSSTVTLSKNISSSSLITPSGLSNSNASSMVHR